MSLSENKARFSYPGKVSPSRKMLEPNSDTSVHFENSQESSPIYTSNPKRIQKACNNCLKQCFEKHQFGIHIEAEHDSWPWQLDKPHSAAAGRYIGGSSPLYFCADYDIVTLLAVL